MNILPRVKSNGSLFGESSNGEGGLENINKYFYHACEGDKGFMDKATKEIEKFSINILRHYKELRSFIDGINDNNIFCISNG